MNLMYSYLIDCSDIDQRLLNICIIQISAILRHIQSYQHLQSHYKWSACWNRLKVKTFKQAYSTERNVHSRLLVMLGKRIKISRRNGLFGHGWTRGPDWNSVMSRWHSRLNRFILIIAEEEQIPSRSCKLARGNDQIAENFSLNSGSGLNSLQHQTEKFSNVSINARKHKNS